MNIELNKLMMVMKLLKNLKLKDIITKEIFKTMKKLIKKLNLNTWNFKNLFTIMNTENQNMKLVKLKKKNMKIKLLI